MNFSTVLRLVGALTPVLALYAPLGYAPLLGLLGCAAIVVSVRRRALPFSKNGFTALAFVLLAWATASIAWSIIPTVSVTKSLQLLGILVAFLAVSGLVRSTSSLDRRSIGVWLSCGWGMAATLLALDIVFGAPILSVLRDGVSEGVYAFVPYKRGATILMFLSWIVAFVLVRRGIPTAAFVPLAVSGLLLYGISSKAAFLAWAIGLLAAALGAVVPRRALFAMVCCAPILVLAMPILSQQLPQNLATFSGSLPTSALHRVATWRFTAERVWERPLLGWGLDSSRALPGGQATVPIADWLVEREPAGDFDAGVVAFLRANPPPTLPLHPHNAALQWWVELGFPGALLAAAIVLWIGRWITNLPQAWPARSLSMGLFSSAVSVAFLSFGIWQSWWLSALGIISIFGSVVFDKKNSVRDSLPVNAER